MIISEMWNHGYFLLHFSHFSLFEINNEHKLFNNQKKSHTTIWPETTKKLIKACNLVNKMLFYVLWKITQCGPHKTAVWHWKGVIFKKYVLISIFTGIYILFYNIWDRILNWSLFILEEKYLPMKNLIKGRFMWILKAQSMGTKSKAEVIALYLTETYSISWDGRESFLFPSLQRSTLPTCKVSPGHVTVTLCRAKGNMCLFPGWSLQLLVLPPCFSLLLLPWLWKSKWDAPLSKHIA